MDKEDTDNQFGLDYILSHTSSQVRPFRLVNARQSDGRSPWRDWREPLNLPLWLLIVILPLAFAAGWCVRPLTVQQVEQPVRAAQAIGGNSVASTLPPSTTSAVLQPPPAAPAPTSTPVPKPAPALQPVPTPTAIPAPPTPILTDANALLPITSHWLGDGLRLAIQNEPEDAGRTRVNFLATNTTGQTMDILVPFGSFYIEIAGQRFVGHDPNTDVIVLSGFKPGQQNQRTFHVDFEIDWKQFQMFKASRQTASYRIGVIGFAEAISQAQWEQKLYH